MKGGYGETPGKQGWDPAFPFFDIALECPRLDGGYALLMRTQICSKESRYVRRFIVLALGLWCSLPVLAQAQQTAAGPAVAPTITLVLPSLKNLFEDMKVPFDLAQDKKGYDTLVDTLEVFLVGIERDKPVGVRVISGGDAMHPALSIPVLLPPKGVVGDPKGDPNFKKLRDNLWDLDLKTAPPPDPAYIRQIPTPIRTKLPGLKLGPGERLMFGGRDGYMGRDAQAVHIATELSEIRGLKGLVAWDFPAGTDLAVTLDGKAQKPENRLKAFAKIRSEMLGAVKQKADEAESAFALREAGLRQLVDELQRFYAESGEIQMLLTVDGEKKNSSATLALTALPGTELEESAKLVKPEPSKYALISTKDAAVVFTGHLPLDPLRKKHAGELHSVIQKHVEHLIDSDKAKPDAEKTADKSALGILFSAIKDVATQGELTGALRSWATGGGKLDTVGVLKVASTDPYAALLKGLQDAGGPITVAMSAEKQDDVEIHKIVSPGAAKQFAEIIGADGAIYIGLAANELWYAAGDGVLPRLKAAITESRGAVGAASAPLAMSVRIGPLTEFVNSYTKRNPLPERPKAAPAAKPAPKTGGDGGSKRPALPAAQRDTTKSPLENLQTLMGDMDLQKLATEAFQGTDDTVAVSLTEVDGKIRLDTKVDSGLLRFLGTVMSKFVKDNLSDE